MGAWIETNGQVGSGVASSSHPVWVRGLKLAWILITLLLLMSHPVWVRGLKQTNKSRGIKRSGSHPVWVRGLKHHLTPALRYTLLVAPRVGAWIETYMSGSACISPLSHPVWVRGLKPQSSGQGGCIVLVAPRVGAWIETP